MNLQSIFNLVGLATPLITIISAFIGIVLYVFEIRKKIQTRPQKNVDESKYKVEFIVEYPSGRRIETKEIPLEEAEKILRILDDQ